MKINKILLATACALLLASVSGALVTVGLAKLKLLNRESWILFGGGSEWFWGFLQFTIVAVTLVFIYDQLNLSTASHVLQSMTALNERWSSDRETSLRKLACEAWLSDRSLVGQAQICLHFFEELGLYAKKQWIPSDVIWETYSWYIESYWGMFEKHIALLRQNNNDSSIFQNFEYLARLMWSIDGQKGVPTNPKTDETLELFARGEIRDLLSRSA
jgi:hypothetical protein